MHTVVHQAVVGLLLLAAFSPLSQCSAQDAARKMSAVQAKSLEGTMVFYLSPDGDDRWSGKLPAANAAKTDGPLATVAAVRDRIRALKASGGLTQPVNVVLRGGSYPQSETLVFTAEDSGAAKTPITYQAYSGETPVITGGMGIQGWERDTSEQSRKHCGGNLWRTKVPRAYGKKWNFNQFFVNGERRTRARIPNKGKFLRVGKIISPRSFFYEKGDLKKWNNLRDVILVFYHSWETSIHHVRKLDEESEEVSLRENSPWGLGRWEKQQRYYVENVFEGLDQPGEWYLNKREGTLYYYPLPGEKMDSVQAIAPALGTTLVKFAGKPSKDEYIDQLHFKGISFQHGNAKLKGIRNPGQGEIYQSAMLAAVGLRNSSFVDCEVSKTGAHGIWMMAGCSDNLIQKCHIYDLNGGGVYIGGGWGINESAPSGKITVDNNFIHEGGKLFHGAHGVWIGRSSYNKVTHNEISNFDYSGISCGWSWGFAESTANHNNLDYNHIHHLSNGEGLSDMGGIYTLGVSPGTTERYNHIHDIYSYEHVSHGSGVYPDEGSTGILVENNVVHRVRTCPLFMHYGKECLIRNNVLAFGGKGQLRRSREDKRCHYIAEGNIVYSAIPTILEGRWKNGDWQLGKNVYWSTAGNPKFGGMDFETWKVKGKDEDSILADPLFVDAENGDFRLKPNSPALALGFKEIDLSNTGLYGDEKWKKLPQQFKNRELVVIPPPKREAFVCNFNFDSLLLNTPPPEGQIVAQKVRSAIVVSDEESVSSPCSLKFTDGEVFKSDWMPHIYYSRFPLYSKGEVKLSWDMLNHAETPAGFYVETRQYGKGDKPYLVGSSVSVDAKGLLHAAKKPVASIPLGKWVHVEITFNLGENTAKTWTMKLSVPGREPIVAQYPYGDLGFDTISWLGISSTSENKSVFYIDNLKMGTKEELAKPPKYQRRQRQAKKQNKLLNPANSEMLMGHWSFDDIDDGYVTADSSGYKNEGEVLASLATGSFGAALLCRASTPLVDIADDETLQFGTDDFSIELWLCPTVLKIDRKDQRRRFLSKNGYPKSWWNMNIKPDGQIASELYIGKGHNKTVASKKRLPENAWSHLAMIVDRKRGQVHYYINGELDSSQKLPETFQGSLDVEGNNLTIGSSWNPFIGLLDEVKIYRRVLGADEVKSSYDKLKKRYVETAYEAVDEEE